MYVSYGVQYWNIRLTDIKEVAKCTANIRLTINREISREKAISFICA